jgi:hypothetical protein
MWQASSGGGNADRSGAASYTLYPNASELCKAKARKLIRIPRKSSVSGEDDLKTTASKGDSPEGKGVQRVQRVCKGAPLKEKKNSTTCAQVYKLLFIRIYKCLLNLACKEDK